MTAHCFHWTHSGEECCECGVIDPTGALWGLGGCPGRPADTNARRLQRWKDEALPLLELLDRCHDLLPPDAQADLGHSKAEAVENYLIAARRWWR